MLKDKIKEIFSKERKEDKQEDGNNKKKIENLAVFVVILIITLIAINVIWNGDKENKKETQINPNKKLAITEESTLETSINKISQDDLSSRLEEILEKIDGVGKVKVLITYSQTSETIPMYNEDTSQKDTEEQDTSRWH